ncbi:MAG: metallophosphoesterase [Bacteroidales bacterium]|nr:metallophosphoesterase [Bacteroidales bacterium]
MKTGFFIIFFSVVTLIYGLVNFYIFSRAVQAFPHGGPSRSWFTLAFWLIASAFVIARILERAWPCGLTGILTWIGSFWLAFMLYFIMVVILVDLARLTNYFFHWFPAFFYINYQKTKTIVFIVSVALVALTVVYGFINARIPVVKNLDLVIHKKVEGERTLSVAMVSDIHLGTLIARRKATRLVETINSLHPDIVLFVGDIVDEDLAPVIKNDLGKSLSGIKSKLGVYAVTGNHEYIGGAEPAVRYLEKHGINFLRDSMILIDNRFYLAGRDDHDKTRFTGKKRKELNEILRGADHAYPVILMDHQPFSLDKAARQGIDLSLSGHTHDGQLWPFSYIPKAMYELSYGYKQIGNTHFYVSSGFGTWGPPVRLGNRPEIVHIKITFEQ